MTANESPDVAAKLPDAVEERLSGRFGALVSALQHPGLLDRFAALGAIGISADVSAYTLAELRSLSSNRLRVTGAAR